jgi:arylsulfatase A-like enzyme
MKPLILALTVAFTAGIAPAAPTKPNVLLILADDLGWSDLGCYGGEIRTPNLDALAAGGLRFTQFYTSARCSPTRASLLTGLHPHQAGFPNLSGVLPANCVTIPEVLKPTGYDSYMVGKWHLNGQKSGPVARGFDEYYGMLHGFDTFWSEKPYIRLPPERPARSYPAGGFYATDTFGDYATDFLDQAAKADRPWFFYLAFNAPHFPLHAPEVDVAKYEAVYASGWDKVRERRLTRQKELGLVPKDMALPPRSTVPSNRFNEKSPYRDRENPAWESLPADRRADLARRMAVYAAMVDRLDRNLGRVVDRLKQQGQFENTLILFLSDNGACAEWEPFGFDGSSGPNNVLHRGDDLKKIGAPGSYISYGSGWANACNTPWRLYKHYTHEGGISTPFIAHWPAGLKRHGELDSRPLHVHDVLPTLLELTSVNYPTQRDGIAILPLEGCSFVPAFRGEPDTPRALFFEHEGHGAVREGNWKLVNIDSGRWELYDVSSDREELHDKAAERPEIVKALAAKYAAWASRVGLPQRPGGGAKPRGKD